MSLRLAGLGWVTPLGSGINDIWAKLLAGEEARATPVDNSLGKKTDYLVFAVPPEAFAEVRQHPRLRRSSAISRFSVAAGLAALRNAKIELDEQRAARTALVFAISNGGVIYTKRFYHDIVQSGAGAASPLLFPETVFNAPASHLAAILGITGATYTVVGDAAVGVLALLMAEDLMMDPELEHCLIVGAEEADWLLCDAYRKWRLMRSAPPIEPFARPPRGMILSEGAGAILLSREGDVGLESVIPGGNFARQDELVRHLDRICHDLDNGKAVDVMLASANGTFVDDAERVTAAKHFARAAVYSPKPALGESVAAGAFWQIICAAQALRTQQLPPLVHLPEKSGLTISRRPDREPWRRAVITTCGLNQQVGAIALTR
jgi:3-oxoacyl-(acyl-carrier-protein) synthase